MKTNKIDLYEYFGLTRPENGAGYLYEFIIDDYNFCTGRKRPAMLVIAGGGYGAVSQREKEPIAFLYLSQGYHTFTLEYSCRPVGHPYQLLEGSMAMAYIREHTEEYNIIPDKVGAVGFSAGGHLCGMLATYADEPEVTSLLGERAKGIVPDAVILSYPVITCGERTHGGTFENLSHGDQKIKERFSIEKRVTEKSSPAFIWATVTDQVVPMENSMLVASAYRTAGVPFELHIFAEGQHGLSLSTKETIWVNEPVQAWIPLHFTWLESLGFKIQG